MRSMTGASDRITCLLRHCRGRGSSRYSNYSVLWRVLHRRHSRQCATRTCAVGLAPHHTNRQVRDPGRRAEPAVIAKLIVSALGLRLICFSVLWNYPPHIVSMYLSEPLVGQTCFD